MGNDAEKTSDKTGVLPWYFKTSVIVVVFLSVGPLALPMVWFHPRYKLLTKVAVTVLTVAATYYLMAATANSVKLLTQLYHALKGS